MKSRAEIFSKLLEGKVYYANSAILYEDQRGVLWVEDNFSDSIIAEYRDIPVQKSDGELKYLSIPEQVKVRRCWLHPWRIDHRGPGKVKFFSSKIKLLGSLPERNREYSAMDLPDGEPGWVIPWLIFKGPHGNFQIAPNMPIEKSDTLDNSKLFIKKDGKRLLLDHSTFLRHKDSNRLGVYNYYSYAQSPSIEELDMEDNWGAPIDIEIVEGLLESEIERGLFREFL